MEIENCFLFGYNRKSNIYRNKKLLNYLDVINIKIFFFYKITIKDNRGRVIMRVIFIKKKKEKEKEMKDKIAS